MDEDTKSRLIGIWVVLMIGAAVVAVWIAWPSLIAHLYERTYPSPTPPRVKDLVDLSDLFGAFSALMASLAFVAAGAGVLLQGRTLASQRELANAQQEQIARQSFESSFFELMRLHRETVASIVLSSRGQNVSRQSSQAFDQAADDLIRYTVRAGPPKSDGGDPYEIANSYEHFVYVQNRDALSRYFSSLYHWFKFIDRSAPVKDKYEYASLARNQLSASELVLLSANILTNEGTRTMTVKFALLKHLRGPDVPAEYVKAIREELTRLGLQDAFREFFAK